MRAYDPADREVRKLLAIGTRLTTTYDAAGQTKYVRNYDSTHAVISLYTYTYDPAGNRTQLVEEDASRTTFSYDFANQLTKEHRTGTEADLQTHVYDAAGNRTVHVDDGARTTIVYNQANRLRYSQVIAGRTTYTFDADGNQLTKLEPSSDVTTNTWSYENHLTQVELPDDSVITYTWAPVTRKSDELQLSREDENGTVHYVWDAENLIRELDDTLATEAAYTLAPMPYGDLVSQRRDGDTSWYHYDALGSARQLTDDTQTETDSYVYSAYGKQLSSTGSTVNLFTWVGELGYLKDDATGDHTLRRRAYEAGIARFLSEDPAYSDANLYRYAMNNPVAPTDPSGLGDRIEGISVEDEETIVLTMEAIYGKDAIKLLNAYLRTGNRIVVEDLWFYQGYSDLDTWGYDKAKIQLDDNLLNNTEKENLIVASQELYLQLLDALGTEGLELRAFFIKEKDLFSSTAFNLVKLSYEMSFKEAAGIAAQLSQEYYSGIAECTGAGTLLMTIYGAAEGDWLSAGTSIAGVGAFYVLRKANVQVRVLKVMNSEQVHHAIPFNKKARKFNHNNSLLVYTARVDLEKMPENLKKLIGHAGRHSPEYHEEIARRLADGYNSLPEKTQAASLAKLKEVIKGVWDDIGSGKLRLYDDKDVILPGDKIIRVPGSVFNSTK